MKRPNHQPIPIPLARRLRRAQTSLLPAAVFVVTSAIVAMLWKDNVAAPTFVGQAEPVVAEVSSYKPGLVAGLNVTRFQRVRAGDILGQVITADSKLIEASLAVIRSELDMQRANLQPIITQQRNAVNYAQLHLAWMRQRADLAGVRVNLQLADAELHRTEELFKSKIASQSEMDISRANYQALQKQEEELGILVADGERSFSNLQMGASMDISKISDEPMRAAIAVQEAKLRLTEAELSPIALRAPADGTVTAILHHSGEAVTPGEPIVSIATASAVRIVGYLRPPIMDEPNVGMTVEVRSRGLRRAVGAARIVEVGTQLENIPAAMLSPMRLAGAELGLAIDISMPLNLAIRPGELVDIRLVPQTD